jgi:hypothetical protein
MEKVFKAVVSLQRAAVKDTIGGLATCRPRMALVHVKGFKASS